MKTDKDPTNEETPLVVSPPPPPPPALDEVSDGGTSDITGLSSNNLDLWQELERPWPSTFERSVSLLASPRIQPQQAELYTKSPKPGSSTVALRKRTNYDRGYYTPTTGVVSPFVGRLAKRRDTNSVNDLTRVQSLDFPMGSAKQEFKAQAAHAYRAKILQQQQKQQNSVEDGRGEKLAKRKKQEKKATGSSATATVAQCAFNLANILMGVGLLGLPFVFKSAGWYGGFGSVLFFGAVTWRTSILIGRELNGDPRPASAFQNDTSSSATSPETRMLPPIRSFPDIARASFGETGCIVLSIILYFELFSCICIFFVAMGDHLHQLYPSVSVPTCQILVAGLSMFPTVLLRTPTLLSYLSMVGTFATITLVCSVIASALLEGDISHEVAAKQGLEDQEETRTLFRPDGLALALGLVAYCFSGHAIVPSIYTSMAEPHKFEGMVTMTFLIVMVCCLAVAVSGYLMFGDFVDDQVTLSLEENSSAVYAMKALTWLMILTAFSKVTLTMFPLAIGMEEIVAPFLTNQTSVWLVSSVIKTSLTALALCVSIFVPNFSYLCALVGMICTMSVSVIFPAAAHWKLFGPRLSVWERVSDGGLILLGLIMTVVGTVATL